MCSISGGTRWDAIAHFIYEKAKDRGRDYHGIQTSLKGPWIANHRATPTTEVTNPVENQPVGGEGGIPYLVFNGIISNDTELGLRPGEADTSVLPRVLNFSNLEEFKRSLEEKIVGSYAIATMDKNGEIMLAANYKPIWIAEYDGQYYFSSLKSHFPDIVHPYRMKPYSVQYLKIPDSLDLKRTQEPKALVICSSGLDSTTVAAYACHKHGPDNTTLIHFDYGCHATKKEVHHIKEIAEYLGCGLQILPLPNYGGSALLDSGEEGISQGVAGAEYAHEWVPARNLLMLSATVAYAEAKKYGHIYLGTNLEEAGAYPDNEEQFILDFDALLYGAVQNGVKIQIHTPLGGLMKHEIIPFGLKYDTPYNLTWSCYRSGNKHCGRCGPCFMRRTAFLRNGMEDPVPYE